MEEEKKENQTTEKKVVETKKEEKVEVKKANNQTIIIGVAVVAIIIIAIIGAMILRKDSPKKALEKALIDLKAGAYAQEMLSGLVQGEDNVNSEAQKLLFEKLEWKILKVEEEKEKATLEIEVTNKNFKTIIGNYMQKALTSAFSGNANKDEMTNYLMEELRNEEVETVTVSQTIVLEKKDGKWEMVEQEKFMNIVLPGFYEAISAFN